MGRPLWLWETPPPVVGRPPSVMGRTPPVMGRPSRLWGDPLWLWGGCPQGDAEGGEVVVGICRVGGGRSGVPVPPGVMWGGVCWVSLSCTVQPGCGVFGEMRGTATSWFNGGVGQWHLVVPSGPSSLGEMRVSTTSWSNGDVGQRHLMGQPGHGAVSFGEMGSLPPHSLWYRRGSLSLG